MKAQVGNIELKLGVLQLALLVNRRIGLNVKLKVQRVNGDGVLPGVVLQYRCQETCHQTCRESSRMT